NPNFNVKIVQKIPTGLPTPHLPRLYELPELFVDALSIAVVVVAVHISLAKMFAKKLRYKVDPGQELYALGLSSSLSAFFPVYPVSCSLGRTLVNVEAGTKTQLSTIASTIFLAAIIGYIGQWLETLPMCVLSAIVIVALKGMVKKFADLPQLWPVSKIDCSIWVVSFVATVAWDVTPGLDLPQLWPVSKIDCSIWVVSFVATVAWDVTPGLGVSIIYALMTTVFRTQFPRWHFLATLQGTNDFRDSERYKAVVDHNLELCMYHKGICIFRFDSPLLFTNVEKFKTSIEHAVYKWEAEKPALTPQSILPEELKIPANEAEELASITIRSASEVINPDKPFTSLFYRHFVIDCSGFTFVDYMGVNALKEVFTEMRNKKVLVYFAAAKAPVRDLFEACGFYKYVAKSNFYPTIRDAVAIARKRRNASTMHLLDEIRLHHDVLNDMIKSQPMN
uniref:STAS domain-containing protein n=1 Tax=Panagrolaimus sp. PS1159 TaxID=55785 RepID=A0AC35FFD7_9BILA